MRETRFIVRLKNLYGKVVGEWFWRILAILVASIILTYSFISEPTAHDILLKSQQNPEAVNDTRRSYEIKSDSDGGFIFRLGANGHAEQADKTRDKKPQSGLTLAQADLLAQEKMAHWTTYIAGFTFFGLLTLYWTLEETRAMAKDFRNISKAQSGAYVTLKLLYIERGMRDTDGALTHIFKYEITNHGQTPAFNIGVQENARLQDFLAAPVWIDPSYKEPINRGHIGTNQTEEFGRILPIPYEEVMQIGSKGGVTKEAMICIRVTYQNFVGDWFESRAMGAVTALDEHGCGNICAPEMFILQCQPIQANDRYKKYKKQ